MNALSRFLVVVALTGNLILLSGCGPKSVSPYQPQDNDKGTDGKTIQYPNGQGTITEEISPGEEALDSSGSRNGQNLGSFSLNADQASSEYKEMYGRSSMQMQPVYFDFDQATIRGNQIPRLEHNARFLNENRGQRVVVEGNCDEQGTNEYNLALGERRAINAKKYLVELGVEEQRVRTVSYGEERPLFTGQDEFDYSQNRRDDFVIE